ncbi:MAG: sensor domain-containing diguanylate cyclase [Epsilonproteobacteria bacterium]|nr:sensor domain-containing diguanylate cyclase [Campylobacterota bacterium]
MIEKYKKILFLYPFSLFFLITVLFIGAEYFLNELLQLVCCRVGFAEHYGHFIFEIPMLYLLFYAPLRRIIGDYSKVESEFQTQEKELLKLAHVIEQSADLIMITDASGKIEYVNSAYPNITGYKKETFIGNKPAILKSDNHPKEDFRDLWQTITSGGVYHGVFCNKRQDGTFYYEEKTVTSIRLEGDKITHYISTGKEITDKILIAEALEESEYLFKIVSENSLTGIFMYQHSYVYFNKAFEEITGYTAEEIFMMDPGHIIHPLDKEIIGTEIEQRLAGTLQDSKTSNELRIIRKDGTVRWVYATIVSVTYREKIAGLGSIIDISDRKMLEQNLEKLATTDKLTSLLNRTRFNEYAEHEIACFKRYETPFSVIIFDIDYFKKVNDQFGHDVGDSVLIQMAKIGQSVLRTTDVFFRWGGEEFLILCSHSDEEQAYLLAERLREEIENSSFDCGSLTISGGIAQYVEGETIESTIKRADLALYSAKESGRNRIEKGVN